MDKAVFRQVGQPAATGVVGGAWPERIAGQDNPTPIDGIDAKEGLCHLGPSGPDEPGEAEDLPTPQRKRDILEVAPARQAPYLQDDVARRGLPPGIE